MSAVEKLFEEHRLIERVVAAMEQRVQELHEGNDRGRCDLLRFVTFFREFADLMHHEKEEELLIPALSEAGVRWDEGLLLRIRREHEFERSLLHSMRHLAVQTQDWSAEDCRRVVGVAERFIVFMRAHIKLEDEQLHHLVLEKLTPAARDALDAQLRRFDEKRERAGEVARWVDLGTQLAAQDEPR